MFRRRILNFIKFTQIPKLKFSTANTKNYSVKLQSRDFVFAATGFGSLYLYKRLKALPSPQKAIHTIKQFIEDDYSQQEQKIPIKALCSLLTAHRLNNLPDGFTKEGFTSLLNQLKNKYSNLGKYGIYASNVISIYLLVAGVLNNLQNLEKMNGMVKKHKETFDEIKEHFSEIVENLSDPGWVKDSQYKKQIRSDLESSILKLSNLYRQIGESQQLCKENAKDNTFGLIMSSISLLLNIYNIAANPFNVVDYAFALISGGGVVYFSSWRKYWQQCADKLEELGNQVLDERKNQIAWVANTEIEKIIGTVKYY